MPTIKFTNVGRGKRNWEITVEAPFDEVDMARSVRAKGGLASSGIDIDYDPETKTGVVLVGGFREVGQIEVVG